MSQDRGTLTGVDLNLLRALHALLEERSVTAAAGRLGVSQPTVSAALARLRRHFDDSLLVRRGRGFELTPVALQLLPRVGDALGSALRVFGTSQAFDPSTSDRSFTLMLSDYAGVVLGAELVSRVSREAPHVGLEFSSLSLSGLANVASMLRRIDGLVFPIGAIVEGESMTLYEDDWVVIASEDNDAIGDELTVENLSELPWALAYYGPHAFMPALHELRASGAAVTAAVRTESYLQLPFLVAGSDRIAFVQRRLAARLAGPAGIRVWDPPVAVPPIRQALWWDAALDADPGHRWLRGLMADLVDPVASPG